MQNLSSTPCNAYFKISDCFPTFIQLYWGGKKKPNSWKLCHLPQRKSYVNLHLHLISLPSLCRKMKTSSFSRRLMPSVTQHFPVSQDPCFFKNNTHTVISISTSALFPTPDKPDLEFYTTKQSKTTLQCLASPFNSFISPLHFRNCLTALPLLPHFLFLFVLQFGLLSKLY